MSATKGVQVNPDGKAKADFFIAVRERGVLNSILDGPARLYERLNPGERVRWEFFPSNGDTTLVVAREALGYHVVDAAEIADEMGPSFSRSGPIRRGDLVMMSAPVEIVEAEEAQDAKAAAEDLKLPERTYRDSLESYRVLTKSGTEDYARPIGNVRSTEEEFRVQPKSEER